jgi:hypothetical protein
MQSVGLNSTDSRFTLKVLANAKIRSGEAACCILMLVGKPGPQALLPCGASVSLVQRLYDVYPLVYISVRIHISVFQIMVSYLYSFGAWRSAFFRSTKLSMRHKSLYEEECSINHVTRH